MKRYQRHNYDNFIDYLNEEPNNPERVYMRNSLNPMIEELLRNNINKPSDFVGIMGRFYLQQLAINKYMEKFKGKYIRQIYNINIVQRIIDKSNSFEKNTILTYLAFKLPDIVLNEFRQFISAGGQNFRNKESLFSDFEKEINQIHENLANVIEEIGEPVFPEFPAFLSFDDDYQSFN